MRYAAPVRKYPLQPLQQQREHAAKRDAVQLNEAKQHVDSAALVHDQARAQHQAALERARAQRAAESERAQAGVARASDLLQQAKHDTRIRSELAALQDGETSAEEHLQRAQQMESEQLAKLQQSAADAQVAAEHRRRWQQNERKRAVRHEEESAHETWQAAQVQAESVRSGKP